MTETASHPLSSHSLNRASKFTPSFLKILVNTTYVADLEDLRHICQLTAAQSSLRLNPTLTPEVKALYRYTRADHSFEVEDFCTEVMRRNLIKNPELFSMCPAERFAVRLVPRLHDFKHYSFSHLVEPLLVELSRVEGLARPDHDQRTIETLKLESERASTLNHIEHLYGEEMKITGVTAEQVLQRTIEILEEDHTGTFNLGYLVRELADRTYVARDIILTKANSSILTQVTNAVKYLQENIEIDPDSKQVVISYPGTVAEYTKAVSRIKSNGDASIDFDDPMIPAIFKIMHGRSIIHMQLNEHPRVACTARLVKTLVRMALDEIEDKGEKAGFLDEFLTLGDSQATDYLKLKLPIHLQKILDPASDGYMAPDLHYTTACWNRLDRTHEITKVNGLERRLEGLGESALESRLQLHMMRHYNNPAFPENKKYGPPIVVLTSDYSKRQAFPHKDINGELFLAECHTRALHKQRYIALHIPNDLPPEIAKRYENSFHFKVDRIFNDGWFHAESNLLDDVVFGNVKLLLEPNLGCGSKDKERIVRSLGRELRG